jgi:hypothetical protein
MSKMFGNFVEMDRGLEYLSMSFSSSTLSVRDRWLNNSLLADFLADYWRTLFPVYDSSAEHTQIDVREAVRYIANELLDNAVKFSQETQEEPIQIALYLSDNNLRVYVTNKVNPRTASQFQRYIQQLLTESPRELYIRQVESNAREESNTESRLGLLTIIHDYQAQLAWKFDMVRQNPEIIVVTTMVELTIGRSQRR